MSRRPPLALALVAFASTSACSLPSRDDYVLVPEIQDLGGECASGAPETFSLAFDMHWANGENAQPVQIVVGGNVDLIDPVSEEILAGRVRITADADTFDGDLSPGESATVAYLASLEDPSFGCAAVCGRDLALRVFYGIANELEPVPVAGTEARSGNFQLDCP